MNGADSESGRARAARRRRLLNAKDPETVFRAINGACLMFAVCGVEEHTSTLLLVCHVVVAGDAHCCRRETKDGETMSLQEVPKEVIHRILGCSQPEAEQERWLWICRMGSVCKVFHEAIAIKGLVEISHPDK